ncbi:hypothetical protein [Roseomonas populi]|uniref:Uncharacterized protein n=1 Tax=Roseomonas populi TaxID=3121582 RepID=A0ABT1X0A0_9PROT|nr:hypothetical protein [Roseomonas pecuniae]MCR0981523.1 hypothetical protein [Roseomonas pecuniae]
MLGSEALEIAVGLVLVFLLISLLLTALTEIIEAVLKTRAADLERAIGLMLQDPVGGGDKAVARFYEHPLVFALFNGRYEASRSSWFFTRETGGSLPSYIPRDIFSAVVLDLESAGTAGNGLSGVVESYRRIYGGDIATLKANLESWYDGVMDRAAGWYKRRTQKLLFWLGLTLAVALNINPVIIGQHLSAMPEARAEMVRLAQGALDEGPPAAGDEERLRRLDTAVRQVGLPIGWNEFAISRSFPPGNGPGGWALAILLALLGWLATAVATTLGAPFWFDVLNKLMVIRATVKPKEKSRDEASEDRSRTDRRIEAAVVLPGRPAAGAAGDSMPGASADPAAPRT